MTDGLRIAHLGIAPQWAILRWAILRVIVGTADVKYCNALVLGCIATSVFRTPIASGQYMSRKNLIFRNGDDTDIHNEDEV